MKHIVLLGAPSSIGKGVNQAIAEAFSDFPFPMEMTFENKAAHALPLPEVNLHLDPCTHPGKAKTIEIKDLDALQRLGSTIEQIAVLHRHKFPMVELAVETPDAPEGDSNPGDDGDTQKQGGEQGQAGAALNADTKTKTKKG